MYSPPKFGSAVPMGALPESDACALGGYGAAHTFWGCFGKDSRTKQRFGKLTQRDDKKNYFAAAAFLFKRVLEPGQPYNPPLC